MKSATDILADLGLPPQLAPLTQQPRWVVWKWTTGKDGKRTKPPFQGQSPFKHASSADQATWCPFDIAMASYRNGQCDGIGYMLHGSGIAAFDLDHCRDEKTGTINPWAEDLLRRCGSYAEVTPSGQGLRIIGKASGPEVHRKLSVPNANGLSCEIYRDCKRYITISGAQIGGAGLADIDAQADAVLAELDPKQRDQKTESKNKQKHDLQSLIKNGCGDDFGGDRSRAVWYVINQLLKQGRTADDIVALLLDRTNGISAHVYDQGDPLGYARQQVEKAKEKSGSVDVDAEIKRLAGLKPVQYERERKEAADRLGVRPATLDKLVQAERPDDDSKQGRAVLFPEPAPWSEPVDGAALLNSIATAIRLYVVLSDYARDTAALWTLHTFLLSSSFLVSPRLAICSPVKGCGKTTLLDVLGAIVRKPLPTANVTASAVFRVVEAHRPTLLVDEADTFLRDNDELRGIINSGHRRGGSVLRTVGDDHEPRSFATYAACAIALIGQLPDTLHDRSVVIDLKRRLPSEAVNQFRLDRVDHLEKLASQAARWCADHATEIGKTDPDLPDGVYNRVADNWRPLLAIADVAGGEWPERARRALAQSQAAVDDQSNLGLLLADIKAIFADRGADRLPSSELVTALAAIEGRPWAEYSHGKPISQNQLARALKPLGIAPERIRDSDKQARGYTLARFDDAFERYLPTEGAFKPSQRHKCDEQRTSDIFKPSQAKPSVTVGKAEKSNSDGLCDAVTVQKGGEGENAVCGDVFPPVCEHCGNPETAGMPVETFEIENVTHRLHPGCCAEWEGNPDPDDFDFNTENGSQGERS